MGVEHCLLVKAWLSFYHGHEEAFRYGQTGPVQKGNLCSTIEVERGGKAYVSYVQCPVLRVPLTPAAAEIHLFNCMDGDALHTILTGEEGTFAAWVYNCGLEPLGEGTLGASDGSVLGDLEDAQGGVVALCRRRELRQ